MDPIDALLGRLAVNAGWITIDQLSDATREQGQQQHPRPIGQILVEKGYLLEEQVKLLVKRQHELLAARQAAAQAAASSVQPTSPAPVPVQAQRPAVVAATAPVQAAAPRPVAPVAAAPAAAPAYAPPFDIFAPAGPAVPMQAAPAQPAPPVARAPQPAQPVIAPGSSISLIPVEKPAAPPPAPVVVPVAPAPAVVVNPGAAAWLNSILADAVRWGASDVHIHSGARLRMRILGELKELPGEPLPAEPTRESLLSILTAEERAALDENGQVDIAYTLPDVGRFRGNVYVQQRGTDASFRIIPARPPTLAELNLPQSIARVTTYHQGIVLFTGPAGCGKTATMASILNLINEERTDHILTVEDPIEILHRSNKAIVNQRQAGKHTASFARALKAALREDPDIVVIGEMRDYETVSMALKAAETGHLVMATLHTNNAIRTINRIIGVFPPNQQSQIRTMISESLRAVISQRLCVRADGRGRVPALEILYVNPAIGNLIRENRTIQLKSVLQTQTAAGMCLLDRSLADLVRQGVITRAEAMRHAEDPKNLPGA